MYTKSPWVLVEISSYSFGHFGWSDLREKKDCRKLFHDVACEVSTAGAGVFSLELNQFSLQATTLLVEVYFFCE